MEPVYRAALALGTANQLTNILRDVGEDIRERNRIYVPIEDLESFGLDERELVTGVHARSNGEVDDRYKRFLKHMVCHVLTLDLAAFTELQQDNSTSGARCNIGMALSNSRCG